LEIETGTLTNNYVSKSDDEIKDLAMSLFKGEIFCDRHLHSQDMHLMQSIFMPLVFMDEVAMKQMKVDNIGLMYEYYSYSMPHGINGYPCFPSFKYLDVDDTNKVLYKYEQISKAMEVI
jgi:hypothetical protein